MNFLRILTVLTVCLSSGCSGFLRKSDTGGPVWTGQQPDWVLQSSAKYPKQKFLTGVGSGNTRNEAEKDARAELARIFHADIDSKVDTYRKYFQSSVETGSDEFTLHNLTTISARQAIEGSEIVEIYRPPHGVQFFALAVLERAKSGRILRDKIFKLDAEIELLESKAEASQEKLSQLRYFKRAVPKFALRDAFESQLRIVDLAGGGIETHANFEEVKSRIDKILAEDVSIAVNVSGQRADDLRSSILKELTSFGLPTSKGATTDKPVDLKLDIQSKYSVTQRKPEFFDVSWAVSSKLIDNSGKELSTKVHEVTGGYVDKTQAERLSYDELSSKVSAVIASQIDDYLMGR